MLVRRGVLLVLAVLLAAGVPAASQSPPPRDPRTERVVEALLIWRLVDDLNLTDQQIARIFPQIKALKEIRLALGRRRMHLEAELRALLQAQPRDEAKIRAKVAQLEQLRNQIIGRREHALREIHDALSVEQQGRFALIQETFEANTIRMLEEVRRLIEQQQSGRRQ
jgi:Spy/CpxP family protein refolding chaperone